MQPTVNLMSLRGLLASWLAAVSAYAIALLLAASGQGFGGVLAGCQWIGLSVPPHRQVWALVNEPAPNFASQAVAAPYWLGSFLLPLVVALTAVALLPRSKRITSELLTVQLAAAAAVVGGAWLPLLEPAQGHIARWLAFRRWPDELLFAAPVLAAVAFVLPTLRLLALARVHHREMPRLLRVAAVTLHLLLPSTAFVVLGVVLLGRIPVGATSAALAVAGIALPVAFVGFPPALVYRLEGVSGRHVSWLAMAALIAASVIGIAGRPLAGDHVTGLLWRAPAAYDNIPLFIEPVRLGGGSVAIETEREPR